MQKKVLLGMSGGVDSFTSAILLQQQGYEVVGITFVLWHDTEKDCNPLPHYVYEAKKLAKKINIEHIILDLRTHFNQHIVTYFKDEYLNGRTPNPCVQCNNKIKWTILNEQAKLRDIPYIATGHYAIIKQVNGLYYIHKGKDEEKEQSFFLWGITQDILQKTILPLGKYTKPQINDIAKELGFNKEKNKESIGMCFASNKSYHHLLNKLTDNIKLPKGKFIDKNGNILGHHKGYPFYTVGQRRGLGLVTNEALYITQIQADSNTIVLGNRDDLYKTEMFVKDYNFQNLDDIKQEVISKIRYRKQAARSIIQIIDNNLLKVTFIPNEWSIAPGQTVAFYIGDRLIGGGFINE